MVPTYALKRRGPAHFSGKAYRLTDRRYEKQPFALVLLVLYKRRPIRVSKAKPKRQYGYLCRLELNMNELGSLRRALVPFTWIVLLSVGLLVPRPASAQAAAAATASTPPTAPTVSTNVGTTEMKKPGSVALAAPAAETGSPHLVAHNGPPAEEVNRKLLEEKAGIDAAKLLLRSSPSGAQIFINSAFVGHTPLLLMVAPGKYTIEMRGQRDDTAKRTLGLMENETQEITLNLATNYPAKISTR